MAKIYPEIEARLAKFIVNQHLFFVATAPLDPAGRINLSPKGLDTLSILGPHSVAYLDLVGSGIETSVRELANLVIKTTQSDAEVIYNPRTDPGVSRMCADITLARQKLGYQPRTSLAEGLRLTLERDRRFQREVTRPIQKET